MLGFLLSLAALAAVTLASAVLSQRKRSNGLARRAAELGFAYAERHDELEAMLPEVARFGELSAVHRARHALRGVWHGTEMVVFDHGTGGGPADLAEARTTALFLARDSALPDFDLQPAGLGGPAEGDIPLPDSPWLDARVDLLGPDPAAVQAHFAGGRARALRRLPLHLGARSGGGWLAVWKPGPRVAAEHLEEFLGEATALAAVLLAR